MATIDMTQRKLDFPPRFLPYLEKHRIYELIHECIELLVQYKPQDHILFLRNYLPCAAKRKDKPRIVFMSPPCFERERFAQLVAECLEIRAVDLDLVEDVAREKRIQSIARKEIPDFAEQIPSCKESDESCICPAEGDEESEGAEEGEIRLIPEYLQAEEQSFVESGEHLEEEDESYKMPPCICVCPCMDRKSEMERVAKEFEKERLRKLGLLDDSEREYDYSEYDQGEGMELDSGRLEKGVGKKVLKKKQIKRTLPFTRPPTTDSNRIMTPSSYIIGIDYSILANCDFTSKGWILKDFPKTGADARMLASLGVLPTHAFRLILNEKSENSDRDYKWNAVNWMKAYQYVPVVEIRVGDRSVEELAADLCRLLSIMPHRHAPMLPRVVLIGSRGSGVKTQAKKFATKFNLVHVEFEHVIAQFLQQDDDFTKLYKRQLATRLDPELEAFILEKALLTPACRNRGWVLTGYPKNIDQMRMLDIIATPPNRVIFLEVPARECFVRLYYRKIDPCLGDEYKLPVILPDGVDSFVAPSLDPEIVARLKTHPKNNKKQIISDIETYFLEKQAMMAYCGKTASYVNGDDTVDRVFELLEQILINPSPAQPPREPLAINYGIHESYNRLKKFRMASGLFFNNLVLNPPEPAVLP